MSVWADSPKKSRAKNPSYTPENSVIFIGEFVNNDAVKVYQHDFNFEPDYQEFKGQVFVSDPVQLKSTYVVHKLSGNGRAKVMVRGIQTYENVKWNNSYSIMHKGFEIKIPAKGGILYLGSFDGFESTTKKTFIKSDEDETEAAIRCLNAALKKYKGTAWEQAIKEKIEEVKKAGEKNESK